MRHLRGRFLTKLQEDVVIRRENTQREGAEAEFLYPVGVSPVKALILPNRGNAEVGDYILQSNEFLCNLTPVRTELCVADEIVRHAGTANEQVLTVQQITVVASVQQLRLVMKSNQIA